MKTDFSSQEMAILTGPGVYIFYNTIESPLYIGSTRTGFTRCFSPNHRRFHGAALYFIPTETVQEALDLEIELIDELKPLHNKPSNNYKARWRIKQRKLVKLFR